MRGKVSKEIRRMAQERAQKPKSYRRDRVTGRIVLEPFCARSLKQFIKREMKK